jgi:hypothetical protein
MCSADPGQVRELLRRAFEVGYDCGRLDEREDRMDADFLPDNVVPLDARRIPSPATAG